MAINLATIGATIPSEHSLTAPTLLRSQVLALVYESVHRGDLDERAGRKVLDGIRGLRIRLLGDRSLQDHAWRVAAKLNWSDTYRAEYIALTQLQADALQPQTLNSQQRRAGSSKPRSRLTSCAYRIAVIARQGGLMWA